ncbi:hypothetical protein [Eudoraea adriatica]|uniref:hypothetical protein n=1 Tax=Eudoraea adriatica TaxID=446681 RepID=UPI00036513D1|nr:hypothetical protein [Eudoraea adriatica]
MKDKSKNRHKISRRRILPILGGTFLLPFFGFNQEHPAVADLPEEEEYETLLKPDGTTVKVKVKALKNSKILKKNISNTSFLNWLGKKI